MSVITLGPEGTFSHELAVRLYGQGVSLLPTISGIFTEVSKGNGTGLVPLENSEAGGVGPSLDGFFYHDVYITGEIYLSVHHHLASFVELEQVRVVYAHPQTHEQCSRFLDSLSVPVVHTSSNAASAKEMLKNPDSAAIVSLMTADLYSLPLIRTHVENNASNTTRFVLISSQPGSEYGCAKCSILVDPREDRAGLLYDLLGIFASRNINLSRIESRPSKRGMGSYVFFIDFTWSEKSREAVRSLEGMTGLKHLGCYNEIEVPEWK